MSDCKHCGDVVAVGDNAYDQSGTVHAECELRAQRDRAVELLRAQINTTHTSQDPPSCPCCIATANARAFLAELDVK